MNEKIILEEAHSSNKEEEVEQLLIYLGLKDELFPHFLSRGLNTVEKFIEMDNFGINKNILTEAKKILILKNISSIFDNINFFYKNKGSLEEYEEAIEDISILDMIRNSFYEFDGIHLTKDLLIKGFKLKSKPNNCLPKHFQEKNISSEDISASVLSSKKIISLDPLDGFSNLMYLYLNDNQIQKLENLNFGKLVYLDLSNNLIRKIENLENLIQLEHLNLEKNCISILENLKSNQNLEFLNISKQYLTKNQIFTIDENFISEENRLTTILLDSNNINDITSLKILTNLEKLTLNDNILYEFNLVVEVLSHLIFLKNLNLFKNPFIEAFKNYRDVIILQNKNLEEFDEKTVTDNEKNYIRSLFHLKYSKNKKEKVQSNNNLNSKLQPNLQIKVDKLDINENSKYDVRLYNHDNPIFKRNKILSHNPKKNNNK